MGEIQTISYVGVSDVSTYPDMDNDQYNIRRFKNYAFKKAFVEENCLMYGSNIILESNTAVYDGGAWYKAYNLKGCI